MLVREFVPAGRFWAYYSVGRALRQENGGKKIKDQYILAPIFLPTFGLASKNTVLMQIPAGRITVCVGLVTLTADACGFYIHRNEKRPHQFLDTAFCLYKNPAIPTFTLVCTIIGLESLTSVFGMGTGMTFPIWSPEKDVTRYFARNGLKC